MALVWAEGSDVAPLAPLWRKARRAAEAAGTASQADYVAAVTGAEAFLSDLAAAAKPRTHALVIGVGAYDSPAIPAVTTSVHGAFAFADFLLGTFRHDDRPLASLEMVVSPGAVGDYCPSASAASRLGLTVPSASTGLTPEESARLPLEPARFGNIQDAFERWLNRARAHPDNAALLYISCHGVWKGSHILLPEDAKLPGVGQSPRNLIAIEQTLTYMFNTQPSVQCFFVDACQELNENLLLSIPELPATPLYLPGTDGLVSRDASLFSGSYPGLLAYGPEEGPPFFTQELMACLTRRGADEARVPGVWSVTTDSLRVTLGAAWRWRREETGLPLQFSDRRESSVDTAEICRIYGDPEVFVRVVCAPPEHASIARLFLSSGTNKYQRKFPPTGAEWWQPVPRGTWTAGATFDTAASLRAESFAFDATPPRTTARINVAPVETGQVTGDNP